MLASLLVGVFAVGGHRHGRSAPALTAPTASVAPGPASGRLAPASGLSWHPPSTVAPARTPIQEQYDQAFSQSLGGLPGMTEASQLAVPAPAVTGGWPRLDVEVTPEGWTQAFVSGLLDVDYARQSRPALASWVQANESPELIPGVPASVADKVLYVSLLDPGLFGGQPTPVASPSEWISNARAGVVQSVSGLMVQADTDWSQAVAAGWQPTDVRMTEEDVSGLLTIRRGAGAVSRNFTLQVIVGSARWHDGYGTVAVSGWQGSSG